MAYYAEDNRGNRKKINEWDYEARLRLEGWEHVILQPGLAIIRKRRK